MFKKKPKEAKAEPKAEPAPPPEPPAPELPAEPPAQAPPVPEPPPPPPPPVEPPAPVKPDPPAPPPEQPEPSPPVQAPEPSPRPSQGRQHRDSIDDKSVSLPPLSEAAPEEKELSLADEIEAQLLRVERRIQEYHQGELASWTQKQRQMLQQTVAADRKAIDSQKTITEACLASLEADLVDYKRAREDANLSAQDMTDSCDEDFVVQLRSLGDVAAKQVDETTDEGINTLMANSKEWVEAEWDEFDVELRRIILSHAKMLQGPSLTECIAELHAAGDLQPHLEAEKKGWHASQEHDLNTLREEVSAEYHAVFAELREKLQSLLPSAIVKQNRINELSSLAARERERLRKVEREMQETWKPRIEETLAQAQEEYRSFDMQLQTITRRMLRRRMDDVAHMRQLRLALCRWRLDYQKTFHDHRKAVAAKGSLSRLPPAQHNEARLALCRHLVHDLWSRNEVPNSEVRHFVDRLCEAAAADGRAAPLEEVYRAELADFGALPLLEHADKPELMEIWMQALREGEAPPGASRRPSYESSAASSSALGLDAPIP